VPVRIGSGRNISPLLVSQSSAALTTFSDPAHCGQISVVGRFNGMQHAKEQDLAQHPLTLMHFPQAMLRTVVRISADERRDAPKLRHSSESPLFARFQR
jgi:hypothetical protein